MTRYGSNKISLLMILFVFRKKNYDSIPRKNRLRAQFFSLCDPFSLVVHTSQDAQKSIILSHTGGTHS